MIFQNPLENKARDDQNVVIFIHGLAGSPISTWSKMSLCFAEDTDFRDVCFDYYTYPTRIFRLPFTPPLPGLRDLADGLSTFIEERHGESKSIYIVAHSLGGVIVRQMLVTAIRSGKLRNVKKVALLAVPNTGSALANVGSMISFAHRQLKSLCKDEEGLITLNIDWEHLKIEERLQVRYIVGGSDRVVPPESGAPFIGRDNRSVLITADHRSIVAPTSREDIRYKTVKRFLTGSSLEQTPVSSAGFSAFERAADPIFEVYTPKDEPYYVVRAFDNVLTDVLTRGHVWLTGVSGIGKSAAARRAVYSSGWKLYHINLSGHEITSSDDLLAAIFSEIIALNDDFAPVKGLDYNEQLLLAKRAMLALRSDKITAIVIEEMPINIDVLASSADVISKFLDQIDADGRLYGQVRFIFSSINEVSSSDRAVSSKALEKIHFLAVEAWNTFDIERLVRLLCPIIKPALSSDEQSYIANVSKGSPRFVKMIFRHWKNATSEGSSVENICSRVTKELLS